MRLLAFGALVVASAGGVQAAVSGDPMRGHNLYAACMGCHSLDENDVGPKHRGVVGRRAGSVAGYAYSPALRASGIIWSAENLNRWLAGPQAFVPGARMYFSLSDPQKRADIIAYLAQQR
jgi:cytochrome c